MSTSPLRKVAPPAITVAIVIAVWQLYVQVSGIRPRVLPSPARIAEQGWTHRTDIAPHVLATLNVTLIGFAVSLSIAWLLAIAVDFVPFLHQAFVPLLVVSQTLPIVAIAPLMIIWFGIGLLPKIVLVALTTFFPVTIGLIEGFRSTDRDATALLTSMGSSRWQLFRYVRLPGAMPRFFTALRIGVTYAVVAAVFAEYAGSVEGLGVYMLRQKQVFRTDLVLAAVAVTSLLTIALFLLTHLAERIMTPWAIQERVRQ